MSRSAELLDEAAARCPTPTRSCPARPTAGPAAAPTAVLRDGRDALLAVGMNGEPLPVAHGFPVRMVVPGLYGYVSACKWITEIELTRFDDFDAYWVPRGWSAQGPIKTQSRIDTPRDGATRKPGTVTIAGVAWAQHRGISKVEIQVDDGPWATAEPRRRRSADTWRPVVATDGTPRRATTPSGARHRRDGGPDRSRAQPTSPSPTAPPAGTSGVSEWTLQTPPRSVNGWGTTVVRRGASDRVSRESRTFRPTSRASSLIRWLACPPMRLTCRRKPTRLPGGNRVVRCVLCRVSGGVRPQVLAVVRAPWTCGVGRGVPRAG